MTTKKQPGPGGSALKQEAAPVSVADAIAFDAPTSPKSVRSFGHLRDVIAYASLDAELWELLLQPVAREEIRQALLVRYFPLIKTLWFKSDLVLVD